MSQQPTPCKDFSDRSSLPDIPPEIRFDPAPCPPEVIEKANASQGRTGARKFEPAEVAMERMRTDRSPSPVRFYAWAQHPDERVVIEFLKDSIIPAHNENSLYDLIASRAIQEAHDRGEIWTPLLDALSGAISWPEVLTLETLRESRLWKHHDHLDKVVAPWIARQSDPNVLRHVALRTRSRELLCYIAGMSAHIDHALVDAVLKAYPPAMIDFLNNDHLSPELYEIVLDRLVTAIPRTPEDPYYYDNYPIVAYQTLVQRGVRLRTHHIECLIKTFDDYVTQSNALQDAVCDRILSLFCKHAYETGDEEVALQVIQLAGKLKDATRIWTLISNQGPNSTSRLKFTPRLAHAALSYSNLSVSILETVAEHPELRQDPHIRSQLLEFGTVAVLRALAWDDRPEEFPLIFTRTVSIRPQAGLYLLNQFREMASRTLSRADLLPLLQASSREIRLAALAFLGELQKESINEAPRRKGVPSNSHRG